MTVGELKKEIDDILRTHENDTRVMLSVGGAVVELVRVCEGEDEDDDSIFLDANP